MAVFRTEGSAAIGSGHIVRCLTLIEALAENGWTCAMAGTATTRDMVARAGSPDLAFHEIDQQAFDSDTMWDNWPDGTDLLVVDHYGLDISFEKACRGWAKRILVIDDLADRDHDADYLLDQTYRRAAADYQPLVPEDCTLMLGSEFALLRPAFATSRAAILEDRAAREDVQRILVSVGSTDPDNYAAVALNAIARTGLNVAVDVILASSAPHVAAIHTRLADERPDSELHTDIGAETLARILGQADLAIGAGGAAAWERCCLGLPTLAVMTAGNQQMVIAQLAAAGAVRALGTAESVDAAQLATEILNLATNTQSLRDMAARASHICDGQGARRVAAAIAH